ncbi:MAG: tetratricopeptide repeat protein [Blastocatellia bacterium]|nr:tetratricopeptide repeat protein [Blastocatellia bacterium]
MKCAQTSFLLSLFLVAALLGKTPAQEKYSKGGPPKPSKTTPAKATPAVKPVPPAAASPLKQWEEAFEKGKTAFDKGDYRQAQEQFRTALPLAEHIKNSPQPLIQTSLGLGNAYAAQEKLTEAEPLYRQAWETQQKTLGNDHADTQKTARRLEQLYLRRATIRVTEGHRPEAIQDYSRAAELFPEAGTYGNRGDLKAAGGDDEGALQDYRKAAELDPANAVFFQSKQAGLFAARGRRKNNNGDFIGALADLKQAARLDPPSAPVYADLESEVYLNQATLEINQGNFEAAFQTLNQALKLNPNNSRIPLGLAALHENRGVVNTNNGDHAAAITDFSRARELDPAHAERYQSKLATVYFNRGTTRANNSDFDAALADFRQAVEADPPHRSANLLKLAEMYYSSGIYRANQNDQERAIADFSKAIETNPNFAAAYARRAFAYKQKNRLKEAQADAKKAKELDSSVQTPF